MRGDALNLVIAAVSIAVGAVISYYFYRVGKKVPLPVYAMTGNVVVRGDEEQHMVGRRDKRRLPKALQDAVSPFA